MLAQEAYQAKQSMEAWRLVHQTKQAALLDLMTELGMVEKPIELPDGEKVKAIQVWRNEVQVDWDGVRKALGTRTYNKVTERVPKKELLNRLIENNEIDSEVVADHITQTRGGGHVRFIKAKEESSGAE